MVKIFVKLEIQKIRDEFREFYGELPIEELLNNSKLIEKIEKIEKQARELCIADSSRATKERCEQVEKTFVQIWEALSTSLQGDREISRRFLVIQRRARDLTNFIEMEIKNEQTSR